VHRQGKESFVGDRMFAKQWIYDEKRTASGWHLDARTAVTFYFGSQPAKMLN
jgi:hypothetical protein